MSQVSASQKPEDDAEAFFGTEQITSSPTADGKPLSIEETALPPLNPTPMPGEGDEVEEKVIWEGRFSLWNFLGRILWRTAATIAFIPLVIVTWEKERQDIAFVTILLGSALLLAWIFLIARVLSATFARHYSLTNHRLFISSGILSTRKDQIELSRVNDVYTRHSLWEGWLSLGNVVLVSSENSMPIFSLAGIHKPDEVVELIWKSIKDQREHAKVVS